MSLVKVIVTSYLLFGSVWSMACDCDNQGEFLKVSKNKTIVLAKILKYTDIDSSNRLFMAKSMEVEVIENYNGRTSSKIIKVWGDNGNLCRPYVARFKKGEYYVLALDSAGDGDPKELTSDDTLSNCGDYWLGVNYLAKRAYGIIGDLNKDIALEDLKAKIKLAATKPD